MRYTYFCFKYDLGRTTMHFKFNLAGVSAHNLQIMGSTFHDPEMLALTNEPSGTL